MYAFLPASVVALWRPLAARLEVSIVARSPRGFLAAYKRAGGEPDQLPEHWQWRREAFIKRHMAQVRKRGEPLWKDGQPTRRHLALIMWAYSPTPQRLG